MATAGTPTGVSTLAADLQPNMVPPDSRGLPGQRRSTPPLPRGVPRGPRPGHRPPQRAPASQAPASLLHQPRRPEVHQGPRWPHRLRRAPVSWVPLSAVRSGLGSAGVFPDYRRAVAPCAASGLPTRQAQRAPAILSACPTGSLWSRAPSSRRSGGSVYSPGSPDFSQASGARRDSPGTAWMAADDGGVRSTLKVLPPS
ncbi:hypothetical protein NDU88_001099 [Pleurodeles waltl]|uniref:Uncharacterized protein n=1 Tax=Pleurodeles waltl TaxID=8319 RepID=A0AAV7U6L1_PLEWA|nr:hypothetical protein NDU88_001099 [Pleurodeles waltl]